MTLKPNQAMSLAKIESIWEEPKAATEHGKKMESLVAGVDRMSSAFEDATRTKDEKRRMMDDMHETMLERVEQTKADIEETLQELGVHLQAFYKEYEQKRRTTFEQLHREEEERIAGINKKFDYLDQRCKSLGAAIVEERESRLRDTQAIIGPARRSVELLTDQLAKEQKVRRTRNQELRQEMEDAANRLMASIEIESRNREVRHDNMLKDMEKDIKRLQKREADVAKSNIEQVEVLNRDIESEKQLRIKGQDHIVEKITDFIQRFQAHIKEEGEMGC